MKIFAPALGEPTRKAAQRAQNRQEAGALAMASAHRRLHPGVCPVRY